MKKSRMRNLLKQKRTWLLIVGVLLLIGIGVSLLGISQLRAGYGSASARVDQAKNLRKVALDDTTTKKEALKAFNELANMEFSGCEGDWWNGWLSSVGELKQQSEKCRDQEEFINGLTASAKSVSEHIKDDDKIQEQVSRLRIDKASKTWPQTALSDSQAVLQSINKSEVVRSMQPVLDASKQRTEAIVKAWQSLNQASEKKDKTAYLAAESQLKQAYADIAAIADVSDAQIRSVITEFKDKTK